MTPEEKIQFSKMGKDVEQILRSLQGDDFNGVPGLIQDVKYCISEVKRFKEQIKKARFIFYGLGIGFATAGGIFGYTGGKALVSWLSKLFV